MDIYRYIEMTLEERKNFIINEKKKSLIKELYCSTLENNEPLFSKKFLGTQFGAGIPDDELQKFIENIDCDDCSSTAKEFYVINN